MTVKHHDVAIVGAGINGCVAAKFLAEDHDVVVLEKDQVAAATTAKASGLVSVAHDYIGHLEAAKYAADFLEEYDGTGDFEFTQRRNVRLIPEGTADLARSEADRIQEFFEMEYIDDTAVLADRYPGVFELDRFVGAIEVEQGGWVDPYTLTMTYKDDAEAAGAEFETGVEVTGVSTEDGAVTGAITTEGHYAADHVVVAMAWPTKEFVSEWVDLPVRPFRYQWVTLEVDRDFPDYVPVGWDIDSGLYWRPEHNDDLHVGGGTYFVDDPGSVRTTTTEGFRHHVAVHIGERVQDVVMGSPVTGAAVRSLVTGESAPFPMDNYTLERFEDWPHGWDWTFVNESPDDIGTSQSSRADH